MDSGAKKLLNVYLPVWLLLVSACGNSLSDIKKVTSIEDNKPISISKGVDVIYSDSAKVKAHMTSPLMLELDDPKNPYQEFPKGVKIIFFDENLGEKGTITSDYGISHQKENTITFRKNVVATNAQGETFKSEELIYDQNSKKLYSTKPVQITMTNGNTFNGTGFNSNETLYPWHIDHTVGTIHVDEKQETGKK